MVKMPENEKPVDRVNHPSHYTNGEIEVIDYIRDKLGCDEFIGYCIGNVMKYVSRWRLKGGVEDMEKAKVYLGWAIERAKAEPKPKIQLTIDSKDLDNILLTKDMTVTGPLKAEPMTTAKAEPERGGRITVEHSIEPTFEPYYWTKPYPREDSASDKNSEVKDEAGISEDVEAMIRYLLKDRKFQITKSLMGDRYAYYMSTTEHFGMGDTIEAAIQDCYWRKRRREYIKNP